MVVAVWSEDTVCDSIALAQELRAAGLKVDLYPDSDKVGKQFKYAASRNVPFVAVIGAEEKASNEVSIKDLRSGEQFVVSRSSAGRNSHETRVIPMNEEVMRDYLTDALKSFKAHKKLAEKAIEQLQNDELFVTFDEEANSIAIVMKHMAGNMISRWTDF